MFDQLSRKVSEQNLTVQKSLDFLNKLFHGADVKPFAIRLWEGSEW